MKVYFYVWLSIFFILIVPLVIRLKYCFAKRKSLKGIELIIYIMNPFSFIFPKRKFGYEIQENEKKIVYWLTFVGAIWLGVGALLTRI